MCLGIPGKIEKILQGSRLLRDAEVDFNGIIQQVSLAFVPDVRVGDYVIVHAGFALSKVNEEDANMIFQVLSEI